MSKETTQELIQKICNIGTTLGFEVDTEYTLNKNSNIYEPRYDVVWFLDISCIITSDVINKYIPKEEDNFRKFFQKLPFAVFEVEGADPTTKSQVGNMLNIMSSPFYYKFIITYSEQCQDMYRRALKIKHTYSPFTTMDNIFILDKLHLDTLSIQKNTGKNPIEHKPNNITATKRGAVGGEKEEKSGKMTKIIKQDFDNTKLYGYGNWSPPMLNWQYSLLKSIDNQSEKLNTLLAKEYIDSPIRNVRKAITKSDKYFYTPKLDWCYGFYLNQEVKHFFSKIATSLKSDIYNYPFLYDLETNNSDIFFPLISFEVETGDSKHLNGGVLNMSYFSFCGVLVANSDSHLQYLKNNFKFKNVFFKNIKHG